MSSSGRCVSLSNVSLSNVFWSNLFWPNLGRAQCIGMVFLSAALFSAPMDAQFSQVVPVTVTGELRSHSDINDIKLSQYFIEIIDTHTNAMIQRVPVNGGQFQLDRVPEGTYSVRLVAAPGEAPIVEEYHQFEPGGEPLVLDLPERSTSKPIAGVVSVRELAHPISKKAMREAQEAQHFADAKDLPKAIAKFEDVVRIAPDFRDAHCNLGVLYARTGRGAEARAEFQKALDIGPPAAPIYSDMAIIAAAQRQISEAVSFARKALELDPANSAARTIVERLNPH